MAKYKLVPVDPETFIKFKQLCNENQRKQSAQFKVMVDAEFEKNHNSSTPTKPEETKC